MKISDEKLLVFIIAVIIIVSMYFLKVPEKITILVGAIIPLIYYAKKSCRLM